MVAQIKKRNLKVEKMGGSQGTCSQQPFHEGIKYSLFVNNDFFLFIPYLDLSKIDNNNVDKLRSLLAISPVSIKVDEYTEELCSTDVIGHEQDGYIGEVDFAPEPIKVMFKKRDESEQFIFSFINNPTNILPLSKFFQALGVKNFYNNLDVPEDIFTTTVIDGDGFLANNMSYLVFRNSEVLVFLRHTGSDSNGNEKVFISRIPIEEVLYFRQIGSLRYEQLIYGSGGSSNSYGGAIVGGLLFGSAGAIIGSRKNERETNISTKTIEKDTRLLVMAIKHEATIYQISFGLNSEDVFNWILPDKRYEYVLQKRCDMYERVTKA